MDLKPPPYSVKPVPETAPAEGLETSLHSYLQVLKNRKSTLIGCLMLGLMIAFAVNLTQRPVYQSTAELLLQAKDSKAGSLGPSSSSSFLEDPTLMLTQFRLIRGPLLAEKVLKKLESAENRSALLGCLGVRSSGKRKGSEVFSEKERRALIGGIQRSLSAGQLRPGMRIITISATGYQPSMAAQLANRAAEAYIETNYKSNINAFRQSFSMISSSLAEIREKIKTGEIAFQKIDSEIRLLEALKIYGEKHPLVVQLRTEIPELVRKLKQEIQNLEVMQISQRKDLVSLLTVPNTALEDLQKIATDLYTLKPILEQEVNTNREMYNSIFRRLQEVEVSGGGTEWIDVKLIEAAGVPGRPVRPNKQLNLLLGLLVGLFLGTGLAFFQEYLDSSLRSLDDIRYYLKLFPFGMVPQVERTPLEETGGIKEEKPPLVGARPRAYWNTSDTHLPLYVAEAYRIIRTNLSYGSLEQALKVIQITSAVKGEGKTTTVCNLGISLAQAGIKTLLVDADLRRPSLHTILELGEKGEGLSNALNNGLSWESLVRPTKVPNLFCLTAGVIPPNPAELLASKRMKSLLDELKENFDMVILDSPPVISVADSPIIASRVDGTVLVSRSGFIPRHICLHAKNALESVNGKIIGCVLNGVLSHHQSYYYSRYYGANAYYHGEDGEKKIGRRKEKREIVNELNRLEALKEPLLVFLSTGWAKAVDFLKGERPADKAKPFNDQV